MLLWAAPGISGDFAPGYTSGGCRRDLPPRYLRGNRYATAGRADRRSVQKAALAFQSAMAVLVRPVKRHMGRQKTWQPMSH
jgi:hypothetical protein